MSSNNGFQIGLNGGSLPPGTPCNSPVYNAFIAGQSAAAHQALQTKIATQLNSPQSSPASSASTPSFSATSPAPSYSSAPGGSYAVPGSVSRRGPWKNTLIGFVLGGGLGVALLSTHRAASGMAFFSPYALCFAVSFASIFFAVTQLRRSRVVSAIIALAAGYFISQHLLPGFSLLSILAHFI